MKHFRISGKIQADCEFDASSVFQKSWDMGSKELEYKRYLKETLGGRSVSEHVNRQQLNDMIGYEKSILRETEALRSKGGQRFTVCKPLCKGQGRKSIPGSCDLWRLALLH